MAARIWLMEFLRGQTLAAVIAQGALPLARACNLAAQIAHGLQTVHKKGIVHRDLKPENIFLLNEEGRPDFVKIVDFGIAKVAAAPLDVSAEVPAPAPAQTAAPPELPHGLTRPGSVMGTPYYISPEQARGAVTDFRTDQYALGCMLYEMLAGHVPFDDETPASQVSTFRSWRARSTRSPKSTTTCSDPALFRSLPAR